MVDNRIDKLNDDVEKLRQQWSEVEREKAALLTSKERYQQKIAAQRKVVHRDDVTAKKYDDYLNLVAEVLVLDDSDNEEVEDSIMYDWGEQGQCGGGEEREQEQ
jgi:CRISPR/Cas system-associated endonuclease Cas1